jgi:EAL and modified HD-GYP domain-containing signal transduction protein
VKPHKIAASVSPSPVAIAPRRQARFLARQPILDVKQNIVAYELLFRSGWDNVYRGEGEDSTRQMLDNILVVGAQGLSSNTLAFVNCTRESLVGHLVTLLPPDHTVLEILETVEPDEELIAACRKLKKMGYRLALDDFFTREGMGPLIEMADYVKVDFRASDKAARKKIRLQLRGSHAALLAEKIEDHAEFATAVEEGYRYFQGYFFSRPTVLARHEIPQRQFNATSLLAAVSKETLDPQEIERIVMADPPFCFRLLRLVNSPLYGIRNRVDSIQRALLIIGENEFRKLATVAIAGRLGEKRPHALILLSLQRARFCELLAPYVDEDPFEQYLIGLLSLLDAILQTPMASIVDLLPLRPPVRAALLGESNAVGAALRLVKSFESGSMDSSTALVELLSLGPDVLNGLNIDAARWAENALQPSAT